MNLSIVLSLRNRIFPKALLPLLIAGLMATTGFISAASAAGHTASVKSTSKSVAKTVQQPKGNSNIKVEYTDDDKAKIGPKVTTQQYGDWLLECYDPAINGVNCQIKQRIVKSNSDQNILVMSIAYDPKEKVNVIQYVLPLDFILTPGVSIEVDKYKTVAGVTRCAAMGCFVEGTTEQGFIDSMQTSKDGGRVVILSRTGEKIGIHFSTTGFRKAYDEMVSENKRLFKSKNN